MSSSPACFEILLVEDELADAHLVTLALKEGAVNCRLHHVVDGVKALAYLRRDEAPGATQASAQLPDLILLDLNMPRMNGHEFLAAVKADARLAAIPVVVLTTSGAERDVAAAFQEGAAGFVTKPADMQEFFQSIHELCAYWFTLARLPGARS